MPLRPQGRPAPLEDRTREGYYLGPVDGTNESLILHKDGAVRVRTFRRLDPDQRWSNGVLECGGSVLQPDPLRPNEAKIGIRVPILIDPDIPDPPISREVDGRKGSRGLLSQLGC